MGCDQSASPQAVKPAPDESGERRAHRRRKHKNRQEGKTKRNSHAASGPQARGKGRRQGNDNCAGTTSGSSQSADARRQLRDVVSATEQVASPALPVQSETALPIASRPAPSKFSASSATDAPRGRAPAASARLPPNPLLPRAQSTTDSDPSLDSKGTRQLAKDSSSHRNLFRAGASSPRAHPLGGGGIVPGSCPGLSSAKRQRIHRWIDAGYYTELIDPQNSVAQKALEERIVRGRQAAGSSTSSASRTTSSASGQHTASHFVVVRVRATQSDLGCRLHLTAETPPSSNGTLRPNSPASDPLSTAKDHPS